MASPVVVSVDHHVPHVSISIENSEEEAPVEEIDYSQRDRLVRAAVLSANDGLSFVAVSMTVAGAFKDDTKSMLLAGSLVLVTGACFQAIGKFVSAYTERDGNEVSQSWRRGRRQSEEDGETMERQLTVTNHLQEALMSGLAYAVGGVIPLIAAAFTCSNRTLRLGLVGPVACFALSYKSATTTRV